METYTIYYKKSVLKRLTFEDVIKLKNCSVISKQYYINNCIIYNNSIILFDKKNKNFDYVGIYNNNKTLYGKNVILKNDILIVNKFKNN